MCERACRREEGGAAKVGPVVFALVLQHFRNAVRKRQRQRGGMFRDGTVVEVNAVRDNHVVTQVRVKEPIRTSRQSLVPANIRKLIHKLRNTRLHAPQNGGFSVAVFLGNIFEFG